MITVILLFWIGVKLAAPNWYFFLLGLKIVWGILTYGANEYGRGKDKGTIETLKNQNEMLKDMIRGRSLHE